MSIDSSIKLIDYINKVAREPIMLDGKMFGVLPPTSVKLCESFFVKDDCEMCGKCCPWETNAWTQEGLDRIRQATPEEFNVYGLNYGVLDRLEELIQEEHHTVNGKEVVFYSVPKPDKECAMYVSWPDREVQPRCRWLFEKDGTYRCHIHPVRSITCGMPHCRMLHQVRTRTTFIGLAQYGRNFRLKCPIKFCEGIDEKSIQSRMYWLKRLDAAAHDIGVTTWIPEIVEYIDSGRRIPVVFDKKKKLF